MEQCGMMIEPASSRKVKSMIPDHYLQNMDTLGLQQLEHLEKELEQAKKKILVLKAQEHRETSSPDTKQVSESRYWTNEERQRFKKALKTFGTDFAAIAKFVGTRSSTQVRTHAQKYYAKLLVADTRGQRLSLHCLKIGGKLPLHRERLNMPAAKWPRHLSQGSHTHACFIVGTLVHFPANLFIANKRLQALRQSWGSNNESS
ncbi:hypothetical protein KC19_VG081500 [Ceratodon purpureus]|uniref:Uncharacterized protein n=1 Tax=Ceratodon purpureus TaxID=3225 RepID=A0A8T0HN77_CERPU|nr:hypothetical protein KC19_VG081500 [Ceratodon purpureus]